MNHRPDLSIKLILLAYCCLFTVTCVAKEMDLRQALGNAVDVVEQSIKVEYAQLKVVEYEKSRKQALKTSDRIAGYPAVGTFANINSEKSKQLAKLLLDKNNYNNIRQRCLNKYFQGIRFIKNAQKVEIAIGVPCNQVVVAFQVGNKTHWWGSTLGKDTMEQILDLLPK